MNWEFLKKEKNSYNTIFKIVMILTIILLAYCFFEGKDGCHCTKEGCKGYSTVNDENDPKAIKKWVCLTCGKEVNSQLPDGL